MQIQALVIKGIGQYDGGDIDAARATFQRAIELNPISFEATQNLGFCLEAQGDLNGAMAQYQAGEMILPKYDGAVYNVAYLLEKMYKPEEAAMVYEKLHDSLRNPRVPIPLKPLGDFLKPNGEPLIQLGI